MAMVRFWSALRKGPWSLSKSAPRGYHPGPVVPFSGFLRRPPATKIRENPSENPMFFRQRDRSLGQFGPRKNSYFSAVSLRFFRGGFTTCAEPPRAPHLPALQNSPFADLLAFVLSAIECFFLHHHCLVLRLTQSTGGKSPCPGAPFSDRVSEKSRA